jgi:tRNA(fMet)-specific endonuclease VapC
VAVLLDTDHLSILQANQADAATLRARIAMLPTANVHTSIISFQEQVKGWLAYIHRAKKPDDLLKGFRFLQELLRHYNEFPVLPFDQRAFSEFDRFRRQRIRVSTSDLRIAAIAKANGVKLLSRNLRDFRLVPGLDVEDWTARP